MFTVGTAGHVDHGKSTLVKALSGIDPDRLREEKERGMTIDLGFAWLRLPSGREISIVDVPGHERFIKNMLAGVGGIDLALLVVAADEGIMPQTREHLAILDLLRVKRGMVALTKRDLVDDEWLEMVIDDVADQMRGTALAGTPIVPVSATTREGLDELVETLDRLLADTPARIDRGKPRLPIDRVFTIAGFGTVVTGTLIDGFLQAGQEVEILPRRLKSRIRGLQTHKQKVERAEPGSRVAVNLAGIATSDLARGDVVAAPRLLSPTNIVDVSLKLLASAPRALEHNATVSFHTGAAETIAKIALLDMRELEPGASGWAQVRLADQLAAAKGDLFVIRTPNETIGGGEVVEPQARRHRRFHGDTIEKLRVLQQGAPEELILQALDGRVPVEPAAVAQRSGLPADVVRPALNALESRGEVVRLGEAFMSATAWIRLVEKLGDILAAHHRQYPLRSGMPKEELKSRSGLSAKIFGEAIAMLVSEEKVVEEDALVRTAPHAVRYSPEQERQVARLMDALAKDRYAPPSRAELEEAFGLDPELVNALIGEGRLAKVSDALLFPKGIYDEMVRRVVGHMRENGKITVAEVRDLFGTSRKYALALMEHLDEQRVTRRVGDERVLR